MTFGVVVAVIALFALLISRRSAEQHKRWTKAGLKDSDAPIVKNERLAANFYYVIFILFLFVFIFWFIFWYSAKG